MKGEGNGALVTRPASVGKIKINGIFFFKWNSEEDFDGYLKPIWTEMKNVVFLGRVVIVVMWICIVNDIMNISSTSGVNLKCFLLFVFLLDISPHRERDKTTNWFNGHTPREQSLVVFCFLLKIKIRFVSVKKTWSLMQLERWTEERGGPRAERKHIRSEWECNNVLNFLGWRFIVLSFFFKHNFIIEKKCLWKMFLFELKIDCGSFFFVLENKCRRSRTSKSVCYFSPSDAGSANVCSGTGDVGSWR